MSGGSGSLVVYTCAYGAGIELNPPPDDREGAEFVCFADRELDGRGWRVIIAPPMLPMDLPRSSRLPKILVHRVLPDAERTIYIDTSIRLRTGPERVWAELVGEDPAVLFAALRHSFRERLIDEFVEVERHGLDHHSTIAEQVEHTTLNDPEALDAPVVWGAMMARRRGAALDAAMETWWAHVLRYSRRDQLSLPLVLRTLPERALRITELDNLESPLHEWPIGGFAKDVTYHRAATDRLRSAMVRLPEALAEHDRLNTALEQAHRARTEDQERAALELADSERRRERAEAELVAIRATRSWRLAAPLRALRARLPR